MTARFEATIDDAAETMDWWKYCCCTCGEGNDGVDDVDGGRPRLLRFSGVSHNGIKTGFSKSSCGYKIRGRRTFLLVTVNILLCAGSSSSELLAAALS